MFITCLTLSRSDIFAFLVTVFILQTVWESLQAHCPPPPSIHFMSRFRKQQLIQLISIGQELKYRKEGSLISRYTVTNRKAAYNTSYQN
uniref:Secreted protein n=1 Tax=Pyxicephalus adspersus TaxID=30357 RepID=A0AAV2ZXX0_PYXAD|nr:TPA: hypothetical protein GDO54_002355 [Pyxicephalus adspersus]